MKVNSNKVVTNLNADLLDGKSATKFYAAGSKVADSELLDGKDSAAFLGKSEKATDSDTLDGLDSIALQRRVNTACDPGSSIRAISEDGTPTCEPDDDTSATQVNALKMELGTNDNAPNEPTDPVSYTKVKDIPTDVVNRNAATLQGKTASEFAPAAHTHSGADITSGTVAEARIDNALARDNEVMPKVLASDGAGSGLDADKLDGKEPNQLPGTIASFGTFEGNISNIAGPNANYVFAGPTTTVTTTASQRLFGAAEAPLGLASGSSSTTFIYGLCYQPSGGGTINNFVSKFSMGTITSTRTTFAATASVVPGAGTWNVGFCVQNPSSSTISNNDYVNGWVQVVN
jgi:hypothetical protein